MQSETKLQFCWNSYCKHQLSLMGIKPIHALQGRICRRISVISLKAIIFIALVLSCNVRAEDDEDGKSRAEEAATTEKPSTSRPLAPASESKTNVTGYAGHSRNNCGQVPLFHDQLAQPGNFRILYGQNARIGEWPFIVQILKCENGNCLLCSGSILNKYWIITAGHCLEDRNPGAYKVTVGLYDVQQPNQGSYNRDVSKVILHEHFDPTTLLNDVGLLKLSKPLEFNNFVQPVCLTYRDDTLEFTKGKTCYNIGYGLMTDHKQAQWLQKLQIEPRKSEECDGRSIVATIENTVCIGPKRGKIGASCQGDSGGPNVCYDPTKKAWILFGTVSYGPIECDRVQGQPWNSVAADLGHFRHWVKQTIKNN